MPWYEIETRIVLARAALCLGDLAAARTLADEASGRLREAPDAATLRAWLERDAGRARGGDASRRARAAP